MARETETTDEPEVPSDWEPNPEDFETDEEEPRGQGLISGISVKSPNVEEALGHWAQFVENFETSALEFYNNLEAALADRKIPKVKFQQVEFGEGGVLDARRQYLRIERGDLKIDVCAAPFGTGYFFSWWLSTRRRRWWIALLVIAVALIFVIWNGPRDLRRELGFGGRVGATAAVVVLTVVVIPLIRRAMNKLTYYAVDTTQMFRSAVQAAVTETIDGLLKAKGMRALSEDQKKPIMRDFLAK